LLIEGNLKTKWGEEIVPDVQIKLGYQEGGNILPLMTLGKTDKDGKFRIKTNVKENNRLIFEYIGYNVEVFILDKVLEQIVVPR